MLKAFDANNGRMEMSKQDVVEKHSTQLKFYVKEIREMAESLPHSERDGIIRELGQLAEAMRRDIKVHGEYELSPEYNKKNGELYLLFLETQKKAKVRDAKEIEKDIEFTKRLHGV